MVAGEYVKRCVQAGNQLHHLRTDALASVIFARRCRMRTALARTVATVARPLDGTDDDFTSALELANDRRFVLIGEASHGTHEFYRLRAELTKRLIQQQGFRGVVVEGDWPDALRVNRYVKGQTRESAEEAL